MKPRTKLQKEVADLSTTLKPFTEKQIKWASEQCMGFHVISSRGKLHCVECGHIWKEEKKSSIATCPSCSRRLHLLKDFKSPMAVEDYFAIITVCGNFQVVRIGFITKNIRNKRLVGNFVTEVMQHWITASGELVARSVDINMNWTRVDSWCYGSEMQIRELNTEASSYRHSIIPYAVYPHRKILPVLRRNGFTGSIHRCTPHKLITGIIKSNQSETLLKARQFAALKESIKYGNCIDSYWNSIKICIRNKYIIKDFELWSDYIRMLIHFKKDVLNAKYVCPVNLKKEHDALVAKRRKEQEALLENRRREDASRRKAANEKRMKEIEEYQKMYEKQKGAFFDICIKSNDITIVVLKTVNDFKNEGDKLKHCVFTNEYYKKKESLILSARLRRRPKEPIETIEVSLRDFDIVQSRGLSNKHSKHHQKIVSLVKSNIKSIIEVAGVAM